MVVVRGLTERLDFESVACRLTPGVEVLPVAGVEVLSTAGLTVLPVDGLTVLPVDGLTVLPVDGLTVLPVDGLTVLPVDGLDVLPTSVDRGLLVAPCLKSLAARPLVRPEFANA